MNYIFYQVLKSILWLSIFDRYISKGIDFWDVLYLNLHIQCCDIETLGCCSPSFTQLEMKLMNILYSKWCVNANFLLTLAFMDWPQIVALQFIWWLFLFSYCYPFIVLQFGSFGVGLYILSLTILDPLEKLSFGDSVLTLYFLHLYLSIYTSGALSLQELLSWEWPWQRVSPYPCPYMLPSHTPFHTFFSIFSSSDSLPLCFSMSQVVLPYPIYFNCSINTLLVNSMSCILSKSSKYYVLPTLPIHNSFPLHSCNTRSLMHPLITYSFIPHTPIK